MRIASSILASLFAPLAVSGSAAAEPPSAGVTAAAEASYSFGVRIGGYGFRRDTDSANANWDECRMNGLGLFGQRKLSGPLFVEAGLDTYFSVGQGQPTDLTLDRESALLSAAIGVQSQVTSWLRGYAQLGAGAELARLSVPYGDTTIRDDKVMPEGFVGFGGDIRLFHGTYVGAMVRTLVMGNFNYDPQRLQMTNQWVAPPAAGDVFSATPSFAAQGQFYVRRDL
jgi:hypothetical protein